MNQGSEGDERRQRDRRGKWRAQGEGEATLLTKEATNTGQSVLA